MSRAKKTQRNVFVLSGGAARGAAHVGMMRCLLENGIFPDAFVGTSVGALNSVFAACSPGLDRIAELEDTWLQLSGRDVFAGTKFSVARHLLSRHPYLYDNVGIRTLIRTWAPFDRLEDLPTPVRVVTTHLGTGKPTYHDRGNLRDVLLASTALPGVFPPVSLADPNAGQPATHVDGGVADLVPVAGAIGLGASRIFVLDATLAPIFEQARHPLDVLIASFGVAMRLRPVADFGHGVTVTHLRADTIRVPMTDFTRTRDLITHGHEVAAAALAQEPLRAPRGRLRVRHGLIHLPRRERA